MSTVTPEGASLITPYLTVRDAVAMAHFYEAAFGFEKTEEVPGKDGKPMHIGMAYHGQSVVMFAPEHIWSDMQAPATTGLSLPISFYVYCEDVNSLVEQARLAGAEVLSEPEDMFWGDRIVRFKDPDGYEWTFATKVGEFDPQKIPTFD